MKATGYPFILPYVQEIVTEYYFMSGTVLGIEIRQSVVKKQTKLHIFNRSRQAINNKIISDNLQCYQGEHRECLITASRKAFVKSC